MPGLPYWSSATNVWRKIYSLFLYAPTPTTHNPSLPCADPAETPLATVQT
jgi:hypothetical protein